MSGYFSDRHGSPLPRTQDTITQQAWAGLLSLIEARIADGALGLGFPERCPDGSAVAGTNERALWDRALAEIPRLRSSEDGPLDPYGSPWSPRREQAPPTDAILDLIEMLARSIGQPSVLSHHSYYKHDHLRHDRDGGLSNWVADVNRLLGRNGMAFEMAPDGQISRLLAGPLRDLVAETEFDTGDAETDALLARAVALLTSRAPDAHQDALEKLWDVFERIKTLMSADKKQGAEALLAAAAANAAPLFDKAVAEEFRVLTTLGNTLRIRHSETDKEPISSRREAEYLFHRLFALLRYVLLQTGRVRQG
jgi:hypothetical protein